MDDYASHSAIMRELEEILEDEHFRSKPTVHKEITSASAKRITDSSISYLFGSYVALDDDNESVSTIATTPNPLNSGFIQVIITFPLARINNVTFAFCHRRNMWTKKKMKAAMNTFVHTNQKVIL